MTWEEQLQTKFKITTGDGISYFPYWRGAEKEKEYNTSSFEFINVYGTLVDRKQPQGSKFNLVFYFQGAQNIDESDNFESSADDPRQWEILHPFYGTIKGQPLSIKRNDMDLNITEITVEFWESISPDYPFANFSKKDNTMNQHLVCFHELTKVVDNFQYAPIDIQKQNDNLNYMMSELNGLADNSQTNSFADLQNALNSGLKSLDNLLSDPINALQQAQNFLDLPATYQQALKGRVAAYENIYWKLKNSIETLGDKKYYESMAGTVLSVINAVLVTPITGDYIVISDVAYYTNKLSTLYQDYVQTLDDLSIGVNDVNNAYSPNAEAQAQINNLINYTLATLYTYTFGTKKEWIVVITKDTNIILLTHKYLGLDDNDENIDTMISTNNLLFNEKFSIKKGRQIKYVK